MWKSTIELGNDNSVQYYLKYIIVIELSGVQFGLKSYAGFQNRTSAQYFRPKLHDTKFNYHFITSILKSQNLVSTNILLIK